MNRLSFAVSVRLTLVSVLCLILAGYALAGDGVIEINQAKAMAGGVTPGDAPGFPVTIDKAGAYRLTSNLEVPGSTCGDPCPSPVYCTSPGDPVIKVTARYVSLDLNGFAILGPVPNCCGEGPTLDCTCLDAQCLEGGDADGIAATATYFSVSNGLIHGMRGRGIDTAAYSNTRNVRVENCTSDGIHVRSHSVISNVVSNRNFGHGIFFDDAAVGNGQIEETEASANKLDGIWARGEGNRLVRVNTNKNGDEGIRCDSYCLVANCVAFGNVGFGLASLTAGGRAAGYRGCVFANNGGNVSGAVQIGANLCDGVACP